MSDKKEIFVSKVTIDNYGVKWKLPINELCSSCGQPDSVGECNHKPLSYENVEILGGKNS
jgi:hypothetical protein|tara:strand:- start:1953 stop:2132 length:180 start_codon:yes stop_codon:yes gene_type:complete